MGSLRDNLARIDGLPLVQRVPSLPDLKPGQRVALRIEAIDYLALDLSCRYLNTLIGESLASGDDGESAATMEETNLANDLPQEASN